jgi:NAD(P)-dependent dehydrogenase (short-subunit alcohol dehydrogenase family)
VVTIAPGLFHTPMIEGLSPEIQRGLAEGIPFPQRLGEAEDFAALVEHIAVNRYLNGTTIRLDGALRMPPR